MFSSTTELMPRTRLNYEQSTRAYVQQWQPGPGCFEDKRDKALMALRTSGPWRFTKDTALSMVFPKIDYTQVKTLCHIK